MVTFKSLRDFLLTVFIKNKHTREQEPSHSSFESIENSKKGVEGL